MNKIKIIILSIFCAILFLNIPFFEPISVKAVTVATIENFDTYGENVNSGSNGMVSWETIDGTTDFGETSASQYKSSPLSIEYKATGSTNADTFINLSTANNITGFEISFYTTLPYGNQINSYYFRVKLRDSNDNSWFGFEFSMDTSGHGVNIHDGSQWSSLQGTQNYMRQSWFTVGFQGNHSAGNPTNYVYYYIKNSTNDIVYQEEDTYIKTNDFIGFDLDDIWIDAIGGATGAYYTYIDDIKIFSDGAVGEGTGLCENINSVTIDEIPDIQMPDIHCYEVTASGAVGATCYFMVQDSNNAMVYLDSFELASTIDSETFCVTYSPLGETGTYSITVSDWLFEECGSSFTQSFTFNVYDTITPQYDDVYYNESIGMYIEFNSIINTNPQYNDYISYVYRTSENESCSNKYDCGWRYAIALYLNENLIDYYYVYGDNTSHLEYEAFGRFSSYGKYQLKLYNATGISGDGWLSSENFIYESNYVTISIGDSTTDEGDDEYTDFQVDGALDEGDIKFLIGLGITLAFCGMGFGLGTRMSGENAQLVMGLMFGWIGMVVATFFTFFQMWILFTLSLIPAAYIVSKLYGKMTAG